MRETPISSTSTKIIVERGKDTVYQPGGKCNLNVWFGSYVFCILLLNIYLYTHVYTHVHTDRLGTCCTPNHPDWGMYRHLNTF